MITIAALWCFFVVLPTTYFGWGIIRHLQGSNPNQPVPLGGLFIGALGLVAEVVGIVVWESPFLFYAGLSVILLLEANWSLRELTPALEGSRLVWYRVWMGAVLLLPLFSVGASITQF